MKNIIFIAPPAAGKGTQAKLVSQEYNIPHISTGDLLREEIGEFDVLVNCIMWDLHRTDHIVYKSDLSRMKKNSMIIDVSCDRNGGIETCIPCTIDNPTYVVDGVIHYAVDHTPSLFYKTFSINNSKTIVEYIEKFITSKSDEVLDNCLIVKNGTIVDLEIIDFQKRY